MDELAMVETLNALFRRINDLEKRLDSLEERHSDLWHQVTYPDGYDD